jgi:hypothetical protein
MDVFAMSSHRQVGYVRNDHGWRQRAAFYDATQCPSPPAGYEDFTSYPGLVMTGSLQGCLYTLS